MGERKRGDADGAVGLLYRISDLTGLWSSWQEGCPLTYISPNAPSKAEVLGTWLLSILSGHKRYSHVTPIRCDGVNPGLLGMRKVISEDALRNALKRIPRLRGQPGWTPHLTDSVAPLARRCRGFWTPTPPSSRSTAIRKAR